MSITISRRCPMCGKVSFVDIDTWGEYEAYEASSLTQEDDCYDVRRLAHEYWNCDITPPAEYYYKVGEYIKCHPEEFKGLSPQ